MKCKYVNKLFPLLFTIIAFASIFAFTSNHHDYYKPILMMREDMEAAVQMKERRDIESPGKIWVFNQYIFVIEQYKGIHILDNSDPENPVNVSFIHIDGCTEVAANNGVIYANNAVDLIGLKPSPDFQSLDVVSRNRNVLPELDDPNSWSYRDFEKNRPENSVIVRWESYEDE